MTNLKLPHRRQFLHLAAGAAVLSPVSRIAWAQAYPTKPVRIVVGVAAGGPIDMIARLIGQWLSERLGQQFTIENRPGAGTNIGTEAVVRASPDGYSLLLVATSSAINATLYDKLNFNFIRDIVPVGGIISTPNVMVVHPSFPAKAIPEFIAYAKANPGKINMANPGTGTGPHMSGQLFKMMAGVDLIDVPYRGGAPALTDLISGQVQVMFLSTTGMVEPIRAGQLRALAVTSATRSEALPDVPTVGEFVPGFEASSWQGLGAPKNTPADIVEKLNGEINAGLADPKIRARVIDLGASVLAGSPADFGRLIADETEKWGKVVKFAGHEAGVILPAVYSICSVRRISHVQGRRTAHARCSILTLNSFARGHSRRFGFVRFRRHCRLKFLRQGRDGPKGDIAPIAGDGGSRPCAPLSTTWKSLYVPRAGAELVRELPAGRAESPAF